MFENLDWREPANDNFRKCPVCRNEVTGHASRKYCGDDCARAADRSKRDLSKERELRLARSPERICELCGSSFRKIKKEKAEPRFCSKRCSGTAIMLAVNSEKNAVAALGVSFRVYRPLCSNCSVRFTSAAHGKKYCSEKCGLIASEKKRVTRAAANDNKPPVICAECGTKFERTYGDVRKVYCSDACSKRSFKRASRKKERARLRAVKVENVNPTKVFERDKWKCQICGVKTPRTLRGTQDDRAPELDHVMPLALGGAHSYANTQCACRKCNGAKGATPPAQMSLFAA